MEIKGKKGKLVHIDDFLQVVKKQRKIPDAQAEGFKAYMIGSHYKKSFNDFTPYLDKYLK